MIYAENSTSRFGDVLPQAEFIPKLVQTLQERPEEVVADFEAIRQHVIDPSGIRFSVTGNVFGVHRPRSTWAKYFGMSLLPTTLSPVPLAHQTLSAVGRNCSRQAIVMSLPTIESSFVYFTTNTIQGFNHSNYPVILLALEVLNATEGYLWRGIRGAGLAYSAYVSLDVEAGLLSFSLYRSSNAMKAFEEASSIIRGLVDGSIELEDTTVDAAKSTIVYSVARNVATAGRAAMVSFINQALKGVPRTHQSDILEKCRTIKKADILVALRQHFLPLFDPAASVAVVVTAPGRAQNIGEGLTGLGFDVAQKELHVDMEDGENVTEGDSDGSTISR